MMHDYLLYTISVVLATVFSTLIIWGLRYRQNSKANSNGAKLDILTKYVENMQAEFSNRFSSIENRLLNLERCLMKGDR